MNIEDLFMKTYAAFNARDIDAILAVMHPDVDWPNGWEGGRLLGHEEVREYWMRQWKVIDPTVTPQRFVMEADGRIAALVHQVVRDLDGNVISDGMVEHVFKSRMTWSSTWRFARRDELAAAKYTEPYGCGE